MRKKDSDIERPQRYTDSFWSEVRRGLSFRRHTHIQFTDHLMHNAHKNGELTSLIMFKKQFTKKKKVLILSSFTHYHEVPNP